MSRASAARRIAVAAAFGGTGVGALSAFFRALVTAQAKRARVKIGPAEAALDSEDTHGGHLAGAPLSLAMIGDSTAAGLGCERVDQTPASLVAAGLSSQARRPVRVTSTAKVGASSHALDDQVTRTLAASPHVAVMMIGSNDVTHRINPEISVRLLDQAVRRLRDAGCEVVVGTCPDLGTIEPLAQPLRWLARRLSRQLAAAQTIAVVEAGGRTVSLGDLLGPEFAANPAEMFSPDGFHPSAAGYRKAADALLPSVLASLGFGPEPPRAPDAARGEEVRSVADAAVQAAARPGSEVSAAQVGGRDRGPAGRWALLRRSSPLSDDPGAGADDRPESSEREAQGAERD